MALSDFEFESMCRDLLQAELATTLELFTPGRDRGIDIRHLADDNTSVLIQCKRWAPTAFAALKRELLRVEKPKLDRLTPTRYILATSVQMTPKRKDDLVKVLEPHLKTPADVLGRDDLNGLLARFPAIERRHVKLWLTSTNVLEALINSGIENRTKGILDRTARQLQLWAPNASFPDAKELLEDHHVCVIAGAPGIGKTMLADVLLADYTARKFEPVVISEDISEGDQAWRADRPQIFYYDDFLGRISVGELALRKNEESRLGEFLRRVAKDPSKRLILTTREYILNEARSRYEVLANQPFSLYTCVLSLAHYTRIVRATILYNHLFFSDLPPELKAALTPEKRYHEVIDHQHYNPRVIEHVVEIVGPRARDANEFARRFIATLDDPAEVWAMIFSNLPDRARQVLVAMASLPEPVLLEDLRAATEALSSEPWPDDVDFKRALKTLEGNFISIALAGTAPSREGKKRLVSARDPSITDFLKAHVAPQSFESGALVERAKFFEQLQILRDQLGAVPDEHMERLLLRGVELLQSVDPVLVRRRTGNDNHWRERRSPSLERRLTFLVELSEVVDTEPDTPAGIALRTALSYVRDRWAGGSCDGDESISLVQSLFSTPAVAPSEALALAEALRDCLLRGLDSSQDWLLLVDLERTEPKLFQSPARTLAELRAQFAIFLEWNRDWVLHDCEDPEEIEEEMYRLVQLSEIFSVDLRDLPERAEARKEELWRESHEPEYDKDDYRGRTQSGDDAALIDAMFTQLGTNPEA